jgi:hypothetical protein
MGNKKRRKMAHEKNNHPGQTATITQIAETNAAGVDKKQGQINNKPMTTKAGPNRKGRQRAEKAH